MQKIYLSIIKCKCGFISEGFSRKYARSSLNKLSLGSRIHSTQDSDLAHIFEGWKNLLRLSHLKFPTFKIYYKLTCIFLFFSCLTCSRTFWKVNITNTNELTVELRELYVKTPLTGLTLQTLNNLSSCYLPGLVAWVSTCTLLIQVILIVKKINKKHLPIHSVDKLKYKRF